MSDEERKARWREMVRQELAASTADMADRVKNQMSIAQTTLRALLLANGGAMVALFTFVGNLLAKSPTARLDPHLLHWAFAAFVTGFVLALAAHVMAFQSQARFYGQAYAESVRLTRTIVADEVDSDNAREGALNVSGNRFYAVGLVMAIGSIFAFAAGSATALAGVLV